MRTPQLLTRRRWFAVAGTAAAAAGVTVALVSGPAQASDLFGPGYAIKSADGIGVSHLGAYGPPGTPVPGLSGIGYCADPPLAGPAAAVGYGAPTTTTTWKTADGTAVPPQNVAQAAYVLSQYGQTSSDSQAAATDAAETSLLSPGDYALPDGARALQRLNDPAVPSSVKTSALNMMASAARYAGPYTLKIQPEGTFSVGHVTFLDVTLTSASGAGIPNVRLSMTAEVGGKTQTVTLDQPTNGSGASVAALGPDKSGETIKVTITAAGMPATALRVVEPTNRLAQRIVLPGGTSTAQGQATFSVGTATSTGRIQVTKRAAGSGKALAGVEFAVIDSSGKTVAAGQTSSSGTWETGALAPGTYRLHEEHAASGYTVAADRTVTVTGGKTTVVTVTDTAIPAPGTPAPRPTSTPPGGILPQTGA